MERREGWVSERASVRVFRRWGIIAIWFGFGLEKKTTESNNAEIAFVICENCAFLARFSLVLSVSVSFSYSFWTDTNTRAHSCTSVKFRFLKTRSLFATFFSLPRPFSSLSFSTQCFSQRLVRWCWWDFHFNFAFCFLSYDFPTEIESSLNWLNSTKLELVFVH